MNCSSRTLLWLVIVAGNWELNSLCVAFVPTVPTKRLQQPFSGSLEQTPRRLDSFLYAPPCRSSQCSSKLSDGFETLKDDEFFYADSNNLGNNDQSEDLSEYVIHGDQSGDDDFNLPEISLDDLSEAFASNVSYFYLRNELGLSEEAMWRITYEASSALGMTAQTVRHKVDVLKQAMNLTDDDVRTILERQPTILHLSADNNIAPTLQFLVRTLQLETADLRKLIVASPSIITYRESTLNDKIEFFTHAMGYSIDETRKLLLTESKLLCASVRNGLVAHMQFLTRELEIPIDKLRLIVQNNPRILLYSLDNNLIPKLVFYLILTVGMEPSHVQRLLLSFPAFLDYNLDRHILPISHYFLQDLEFCPTELRSILLKFPRLVTYSLQKIKRTAGYLRFEVSLTGYQVKRVLYQAPQVIGLNEHHVKQKVAFLQQSFRWTDDQVKQVITGMPTLLVLSVPNNLVPKRDYLLSAFNYDLQALGDAILRLPTLLGYSLDKRIRPRMASIRQAGLDPSVITIGIPMKQENFEGWLERRVLKQAKEDSLLERVHREQQQSKSTEPERIVHWTRERQPYPPTSQTQR